MEPSAFISYSHADQKWLDRLEEMLVPLVRGGLDIWSDKQIKAGDDWRKEIEDQLCKATVAVLLVSPKFIASDFIHKKELPPLLEAARQKGLRVLWVPISDSLYERTPIGSYQAAHPPKSPLSGIRSRAKQDEALKAIALEIEKALTQPPIGSAGNPEAYPKPSLSSYFAGLSSPESNQQPLASIRQDMPLTCVINSLGEAIASCYPGQSLSAWYPELLSPSRPTTRDALEQYFSHHKEIEPKLQAAWEAALIKHVINSLHQAIAHCYRGQHLLDQFPDFPVQDQLRNWDDLEQYFSGETRIDANLLSAWKKALQNHATANTDMSVTVALVIDEIGGGDQFCGGTSYYRSYRFVPASQIYEPMDLSGPLNWDPQRPDAALANISTIIDQMLSGCRALQMGISCIEIFAPWQLIAADWIGQLKVTDDFGDTVNLIDEIPFLVRSADRIRMTATTHMNQLGAKVALLHNGQGQWLPAATAGKPDQLRVVNTQDAMVALHSHGPQRGAVDAAKWLKALLKSMVPLALWSTPSHNGDDMEEQQFFACLWSLGLMNHGVTESTHPQCSDLSRLPITRREAVPHNDCLRHLHLLIDTPHQPNEHHIAKKPA